MTSISLLDNSSPFPGDRRTVDHVAEVVKVLVSADRRWRVEIRRDGRCQVFESGFLRASCRRWELEERLGALDVDAATLTED